MPSPRYPLWWIPALTGVLAALWVLGAPILTCLCLFAWATAGYGIGWHRGVRSFSIRFTGSGSPDRTYPPDDCPYQHAVGDGLQVDFGLEIRCNGCGILVKKGTA